MGIPEEWRGIMDAGTEIQPFWTMDASHLAGRQGGRAVSLRYTTSRTARYLTISAECPVAARFRAVRQGESTLLIDSVPLGSIGKDHAVGDAALDAEFGFWSESPESFAAYMHQPEAQGALRRLAAERDLAFCYVILSEGQLRAVYAGAIDACTREKAEAMLRAVCALAQAAERIWPVEDRNWAVQRLWASGLGLAAVILVGTLLLFAVLAYLFDFWP